MLSLDQFAALVDPLANLFSDYETAVIGDIARRLANLDLASAGWETQRLTESGALYQDVIKRLAILTGQSEIQVAETLRQAGVQAIRFDDGIYKKAGMKPLPLNMSPAMMDALKAMIQKTNGVIGNMTKTTAITSQAAFIQAANLAHLEVSTGTMSYDQAIRFAIKTVASKGMTVINYPSGHEDKLDVAMRRSVLTGVSQTAGQLQSNRADEMGLDLVAVSAHAGARNKGVGPMNHASWQGKIYSRSGHSSKYHDFVKTTGYGTGEGLGGWNCRHSYYPYFEGISEEAYSRHDRASLANKSIRYNGQSISLYDATQIQRAFERKIRFWKRQAQALAMAKLNNQMETSKVSLWQARMRDFIRQVNAGQKEIIDRQYEREQA